MNIKGMDRKNSLYLSLLCMWCTLGVGGFLIVANAQQIVKVGILTPLADRKEGGQVQLQCDANNYQFHEVIVEWWKGSVALRQGEVTTTTDPRFSFDTGYQLIPYFAIIQEFSITGLHTDDTGEYTCNAFDRENGNLVATSSVLLSVLYFPNVSFPVCTPAGPIILNGTDLKMRCSSESGNPEVTMEVYENQPVGDHDKLIWSSVTIDDTTTMSLDLTVDVADNDLQFVCVITSPMYFPGMNGSCTIGPIIVRNTTEHTSSIPTPMVAIQSTVPIITTGPSTAIIAGAVVGGVVALLLILILIVLCRRRLRLCHMKRTSERSQTNPDRTITDVTHYEPEHPQPTFHEGENEDLERYATRTRISNVTIVTSRVPEPSVFHSSTTPTQMAEETDTRLIYAKPHKAKDDHGSKRYQRDDEASTTEQSFSNPVFASENKEDILMSFHDHPTTPIKPLATVQPITNVPKKPVPYRLKAYRTSNNIQSPSQATKEPESINPNGGTHEAAPQGGDTLHETSSLPSENTVAQVSAPHQMQDITNNPRAGDAFVYAELDLRSETTQDGVQPSLTSEPVVYASIMKAK